MRSARQIRAMARCTEASTFALPMVAVSDSKVNQATRMPFSMAAPPRLRRSESCRCRWVR